MTREQALLNFYTSKKIFFTELLSNKNQGSASARYVWRKALKNINQKIETLATVVAAQNALTLNQHNHAKNNHHSATPHRVPVRHN